MDNLNQFETENGILKAYLGSGSEVVIPDGIHTIADGVFKGMAGLIKVTLPLSVKSIGVGAFKGCKKLKEINMPEGLQEVGDYAFNRCHDLEEIVFPKTMTTLGNYAFLYCDGLKKVVIEGPKRIGKAAFSHNMSLREISLNKDVDDSNFSDEVFEGCICLEKIILSGEVFEVSNLIEAMDSHTDYPELIKSIAKSVYHSLQVEDGRLISFNINLKNITLPEGITEIGKSCFFDKKGIVSITFPKTLKEIRENAFLNCISLEEVTFLRKDVTLDDKAFRGCCNLKRVIIDDQTFCLDEETESCLANRIRSQVLGDFYISGRILVRYMGGEEQIRLPDEVEIIGERCFFGNERLKVVTCPKGLTEIREQAFEGCLTLQTVALPNTVKRIEREAFAECPKLLKCNIPETIEYIGEYAFRRCNQLPVFDPWPEHAEIDPYAFYRAGHYARITEELKNSALKNKEKQGSHECEKDADDESIAPYVFTNSTAVKILRLSNIKRIGKYAYASCPELTEVEIDAPECVIEKGAFDRCSKLKSVSLNVKEICEGAFSFCRNLEEVRADGVSVLPAGCFAGCFDLKKIEFNNVTRIGARCFDECISLEGFDLSRIRTVDERAFERCDSLKHVELDDILCRYHAFADCASLTSIGITDKTELKSGVFIGCTQVKEISYNSEAFGFNRFTDCLNHVENRYPAPVREVIASIYSCYDIRDKVALTGYSQDATRITIPDGIEEIGQDVFRDHNRLKEISIPKSVRLFGSHAFSMTTWLEEERKRSPFVIVNDVLLDGALCKGRVEIPADIRRIAAWSFAGNIDMTELHIPSESIGVESLSFRNCLNLKKIIDWNDNEYVLSDISDLKNRDYPELIKRIFTECINCFKLDENDVLIESTGNIKKLNFPQGIRAISDNVYKDCHLLETIVFSDETKSIGRSAFESSKWLKSVSNAGAVESIGALAFSGCQSLEEIDLSDSLSELGKRCFEHCGCLKEIHISNKLERIPERAFFRCKSLTKIFIPESVQEIEAESFAFCEKLEEVRVSEKTVISESAFYFCDGIRIVRY